MPYELKIRSGFSAAHNLRGYEGKCENLHGHNWAVDVCISSDHVDEGGLVIDFRELRRITEDVLNKIDHQYLNEIPPFDTINPTSENLARYIHEQISSGLPGPGLTMKEVTVWESDDACATYLAPQRPSR